MNQNVLKSILDLIVAFFSKPEEKPIIVPTPELKQPDAPKKELDWNDPVSRLSEYFFVKDALFLNSWGTSHNPSEEEKQAILGIANDVSKAAKVIEKALGKSVLFKVHAWMRPEHANCPGTKWDGMDYNRYIYETQVWKDLTSAQKAEKRVPQSPHRTGHAIDFHIVGFEGPEGCAKIRQILLPHLEELGLRMEDISGGWVHLDNLPVIHSRFFKP